MLTAVPAWAACFGFALDGLAHRFPRLTLLLVIALTICAALSLRFGLAAANP